MHRAATVADAVAKGNDRTAPMSLVGSGHHGVGAAVARTGLELASASHKTRGTAQGRRRLPGLVRNEIEPADQSVRKCVDGAIADDCPAREPASSDLADRLAAAPSGTHFPAGMLIGSTLADDRGF